MEEEKIDVGDGVKIYRKRVTDFKPDRDNPNRGTQRGERMLDASLDENKFGRPIVADRDSEVVAGSHTLQNVADRYDGDAIVIETEGDVPIIHVRRDWDLDDPETGARRYSYADNRTTEVGFRLDKATFQRHAANVDLSSYYNVRPPEDGSDGGDASPGPERDQLGRPELAEKWNVEPGALFQLDTRGGSGKHFAYCGDAFTEETATALFQYKGPDMFITDPPYAIYGSSSGVSSSVTDDEIVRPFFRAWFQTAGRLLHDFDHCYTFCDWRSYSALWDTARSTVMVAKNMIVWDKIRFGLGNMFRNQHELILFTVKEQPERTMRGSTSGQRTVEGLSNIIEAEPVPAAQKWHNAEKPIPLLETLIVVSSDRGGVVGDLFCGSGPALVAAENLGRLARVGDKSPIWIGETLERYAETFGIEAERVA